MLSAIFGFLSDGVDAIGTWLTTMFTSVISLIYTAPVAPETTGSLTAFGQLLFIGMIVSLFFYVLRWVIALVKFKIGGSN